MDGQVVVGHDGYTLLFCLYPVFFSVILVAPSLSPQDTKTGWDIAALCDKAPDFSNACG